MLLSLQLRYARLRWLAQCLWARLMRRQYVVLATPNDFKWHLMRKHNQRRERGNVQRYLRRRSGSYNATG